MNAETAKKSAVRFFSVAAAGFALTAALGIAPAIATVGNDGAQKRVLSPQKQSDEIAAYFEDINRKEFPLDGSGGVDIGDVRHDLYTCFAILEKDSSLVNDRVFRAWEQMTRHWNEDIKDTAISRVHIFNNVKESYTEKLLQSRAWEWALSSDSRVRWAAMNTILQTQNKYPALMPAAIRIIENQLRSRDKEVRIDAVRNAKFVGIRNAAHRMDMLDILLTAAEDDSERVRVRSFYAIEDLVNAARPGEIDESFAGFIFERVSEESALKNRQAALYAARAAARQAPEKLMKPLMELAKKSLTGEFGKDDEDVSDKAELTQTALWTMGEAALSDPSLFDDVYETVMPYLGKERWGLAATAAGVLADMSVQSGKRRGQSFALIAPLLNHKDDTLRLTAISALGRIAEKDAAFTQAPFEAAKRGITRNNDRHMRAHSTGVLGAIGAAHEEYREESFRFVKEIALTHNEDMTVREVAFNGLAAIAAVDGKYADEIFSWAKDPATQEGSDSAYAAVQIVSSIGVSDCGRFDEANDLLQKHYGRALRIAEKYGESTADGCRAQLKDSPKTTNIPSGLIYTADDYSFR